MSLRNIAIIAHVDHGKTTLVDSIFRQTGTFRTNQVIAERAMDSNELEKERGITILAKCTSIKWQNTQINIVDTPGHADFGGEVERILSMVDGVIILVDAAEGPMPQTKFVTSKALALGLKPIVVINKVDRNDARSEEVLDEVFNLFINLGATDAQLDFPILYASGRSGWADLSLDGKRENLNDLLNTIINFYQQPTVMSEENYQKPFAMLVSLLDRDPFLGRILTGRIECGKIKVNSTIKVVHQNGEIVETGRASKLLSFRGLERVAVDEAFAGDIVSIAGLKIATVADTICAPEFHNVISSQKIDPPTISINFSVNDSPLAGREGKKVTSRMIKERLDLEAEGNVAIKITAIQDSENSFEVAGRGELQLGVLIETMRREGFELSVSKPRVVYKTDEQTGQTLEPFEEVIIDVDDAFTGVVVEKMKSRKADMTDMRISGVGKTRLSFIAPSRALIGYQGEFLTDTKGTGILNRIFHSYSAFKGKIEGRKTGVLISMNSGKAVAYALWNLEPRGIIFLNPNEEVYEGMIVGEHNRDNDLDVNATKGKQLTNFRASGKDDSVKLTPPKKMSLEQAIAYISDDELVEVTPKNIRLRKRYLSPHDRKRANRD